MSAEVPTSAMPTPEAAPTPSTGAPEKAAEGPSSFMRLQEVKTKPPLERVDLVVAGKDNISSQLITEAEEDFQEGGRLHDLAENGTLESSNAYQASMEDSNTDIQTLVKDQSPHLESRVTVLEAIASPPNEVTLTPQQQENVQAAQLSLQILDQGGLKIATPDAEDYSREGWEAHLANDFTDPGAREAARQEGVWQFAAAPKENTAPETDKWPRPVSKAVAEAIASTQEALNSSTDEAEKADLQARLVQLQVAQLADGEYGIDLQYQVLDAIGGALTDDEKKAAQQQINQANAAREPLRDKLRAIYGKDIPDNIPEAITKFSDLHNNDFRALFFKDDATFDKVKNALGNYEKQLRAFYTKKGLKIAGEGLLMLLLVSVFKIAPQAVDFKHAA